MLTSILERSGLLTVFLTLAIICGAQPVAKFNASPVSGCTPLLVNFQDSSTGNPTTWKWDLGNGTISFLQNPSVTYFNPGQYSVKLVVQNSSGKDSLIKQQYISVYALPVPGFSAPVRTGCYPLNVSFTDESLAGSGSITEWFWDFGDGTSATSQNPSHTYTNAGNFNVSLRVKNSNGCAKTLTRTQYIHINEGVRADFSYAAANTCTIPTTLNFINLATGTGTLQYLWNFGDGTTSTLTNPSHIFSANGSFTVTLIVTNSNGCTDTIIKPNLITLGSHTVSFQVPDSFCVQKPQVFLNTSVPAAGSVLWKFGDGTTSTAVSPIKTYASPGTYTVKLLSNFGACPDSVSKQVRVLPNPRATFTATPLTGCKAPMAVQFSNTSLAGSTYKWYFGDGDSASVFQPNHIYQSTGTYTVKLITISAGGCTDTLLKTNYIKITKSVASIDTLPQEGCSPFSWTFSSRFTSTEPALTYFWDFGDGTTSTLPTPTHIFNTGAYTITLVITTASGCSDTVIVPNGIRAGEKPHAAFSADPRFGCARVPINFTDSSTGIINRWLWDFGDGTTSPLQHPIHEYTDTGYFTVRLIVFYNGCADTLTYVDYIRIIPPIAKFLYTFNCNDPLKRIFTDASIGADEWTWDFGDGTQSTQQNPVHIYSQQGIYDVKLTVKNYQTGCEHQTISVIQVLFTNIDFTASQASGCRNTIVDFTATGNFAGVTRLQWYFGDGQTGLGQNPTHTYVTPGSYTVKLVITDLLGCTDSLVKTNLIRIFGPTALFNSPITYSCRQLDVIFNDLSVSDGINPITQWIWLYGDGQSDTLTSGPFQHSYVTAGIYTVTLIVRDSSGCEDQLIRPNYLTISRPVAAFRADDTLSCPTKQIKFFNQSSGPGLQYYWNFGDGSTSSTAEPVHIFTTDGSYTIRLVITDQFGCVDSLVKPAYIKVFTPLASFSLSDSFSTCPPLVVQFNNLSVNVAVAIWDFGDGSSAMVTNPVHLYNIPGIYTARLTVTGIGGCTSTFTKIIRVGGPYGSFTYGPVNGCKPLVVNFLAATRSRSSFIWDFGDGATTSGGDSVISHTYNIPGSYVPRMILVDAAGCTIAIPGPDSIVVRGTSVSFNTNTNLLCDSGLVMFNNTSLSNDEIISYTWKFGDGSTSNLMSPTHTYTTQGRFNATLVVRTRSGCSDSLTSPLPIVIVKKPDLVTTKSPDGCVPLQVSFSSQLINPDTSAIRYNWQFGNGNTSLLSQPPSQTYLAAGNYPVKIIAINSSGCADTATLLVKAFIVPVTAAGADTFICKGTPRALRATGALNYVWTPAAGLSCSTCAAPLANPQNTQAYVVTGTNAEGCSSKDTVNINVVPPFQITISPADTICIGAGIRLSASGATTYIWSPSTGLNFTDRASVNATPNATTIYRVIGQDAKKCFRDTGYIPVVVYPYPTVNAGADQTINGGQTAELVPRVSADVTTATWTPTATITRTYFPSVTVQPRVTTTYHVEVTNAGSCPASDDVTISVICNGANIFIPNTFSPNGDGNNDIFYPRGTGLFSVKSLKVFNRWGEIVFQHNDFKPNDASAGWNGSFKGKALNMDVFVYTMEILCDNNTLLTYKGNIALVK